MRSAARRFSEWAIGACLVLGVILLALLAEGANRADLAAMASMTLLAVLAGVAVTSDARTLTRTLIDNALSIAAALIFMALACASLWPMPFAASPELWRLSTAVPAPLSLSPYRTTEGVIAFLAPCAAYLLGALIASERGRRDWCGRWMVAFAILYSFAGLYLFLVVGSLRGTRLDVGVGSANAAATLFGAFMLIAGAMMARAARGRLEGEESLPGRWRFLAFVLRAPLSFTAAMIAFACLLLTASRAGLIATLVAAVFFLLMLAAQRLGRAEWRGGVALAPIGAILLLFVFLFLRGGGDVMQRFAFAADDWEIRRVLAEAHWQEALTRPLLGFGLNTYHELNALIATPDNWRALRAPGSAHNIFIQAIEETGIVGVGLWALMLAQPLWRASARIIAGRSGVEWAAAALAVTTLFLLHGLVDFALQVPAIAAFFAFFLGASVGRGERRSN